VDSSGNVYVQPYKGDPRVYAARPLPQMKASLIHEAAHVWGRRQWGKDVEAGGWVRWREAMDRDGFHLTGYAHKSIEEDLSETMVAWQSTRDTELHGEYRAMVPARFELLDRELK